MRGKTVPGLYLLLALVAAISAAYYVAGALALREEFFAPQRYAREPFDLRDNGVSLTALRPEAKQAGLAEGDVLESFQGAPFTGYARFREYVRAAAPGAGVQLTVRTATGATKSVRVRLAARQGPGMSHGGYVAFLSAILGVPLISLLAGYWIVAARPRDLNAWLVLLLLAFPETAYGNLDTQFWPSPWYLIFGLWNTFVQVFSFAALLWFAFLFPERWRLDRRVPWLKYLVLTFCGLQFVYGIWYYRQQYFDVQSLASVQTIARWTDRVTSTVQIACVLLFLAALFDKLRSASADGRRRLRVLAIGSAISLGPLVLSFTIAPLFGLDPHHGDGFMSLVPFVAIFPLTLAYVLVVQRAMEVRILLRMGTRYLLARATLIVAEIAVVVALLVRLVFPLLEEHRRPVLSALLLVACAGLLVQLLLARGSVGPRAQRWLDKRFFREAYDSETVLRELSEQVRQLDDSRVLIDTVLRRISEVLHVSDVALLLRASQSFELEQALGAAGGGMLGLPESSATVQNLLRTNAPATLYRDRPEAWFSEAGTGEQTVLRQMQAELLLGVHGRARLIGLLALGAKKSEEPYTPTDLRTLQSVATQTGLSLEIAEMVRTLAEQAAQRERIQREMEIAREVQERLFPQNTPLLTGVSLAGHCRPALEVGGDYYDLMELADGSLGFAIGDVSGKGISAALIMASLRASLRSLVLDVPKDLAVMMERVNRLVYEASSSSRYATFFFATYDPRARVLRYVNAGHNPPFVVNAAAGKLLQLETSGPVVGMLPLVSYEAHSLCFEQGDLLLAYTDGISEAMNTEDEEWGEERMMAAVASATHAASAEQVLATVFSAADAFTAGAHQHDDMTLLVLKLIEA